MPFYTRTQVGVAPFKDVFWTRAHQPGSPYENTSLFPQQYAKCMDATGRHSQRNYILDSIASAFSAGPVGIGDGDGLTDPALALATCTSGGKLLPPSKPLSPLDLSFWAAAQPKMGGADVSRLLGTYSNISGHFWQYVLAVDTPRGTASIFLSDLHWPLRQLSSPPLSQQYALHTHGAKCDEGAASAGCVSHVTPTTQIELFSSPGTCHTNGTHSWGLFMLRRNGRF